MVSVLRTLLILDIHLPNGAKELGYSCGQNVNVKLKFCLTILMFLWEACMCANWNII